MAQLDPITLAVIQNGLQQVCNEMDLAFVRAAFSPVISEALDRSDGIYHRTSGELIAKASPNREEILLSSVNLNDVDVTRTYWPFFRDRRIDAYEGLEKRYLD